jgi:hypothetical protein
MLPVLAVNWFIYIRKITKRHRPEPRTSTVNIPIKSVLGFIIPVIVGLCASIFSESIARDQVLRKVNSLPDGCNVL